MQGFKISDIKKKIKKFKCITTQNSIEALLLVKNIRIKNKMRITYYY